MSVFLTPDLKPFVGGTYLEIVTGGQDFPRCSGESRTRGKNDRNIVAHGNQVAEQLKEYAPQRWAISGVGPDAIATALNYFTRTFDDELGGFGEAPHSAAHHAKSSFPSLRRMRIRATEKLGGRYGDDHAAKWRRVKARSRRRRLSCYWWTSGTSHTSKDAHDQARSPAVLDAFQVLHDVNARTPRATFPIMCGAI
jgi:hypothetical protein